ncbi:MAG TPA: oligosaccharide flippase family protein [Sideroxyarcus sp.]|nr:oligosaccharide flippase family protein [Sideroxyarcus sp.]
MSLRKNILANYLGAGTIAIVPILALPWYLAALGPKQFGLIGFIVMLQAVLGLLDAGMSQAIVREITVRLDGGERGRYSAASLLYGFERIYWSFALGAGCLTLLLADAIATHWLNLKGLPPALGKEAIYGAAVIFAVQFPGSVYRSLLVGAQAQVALNGIMLAGALLRHVGGVIVVLVWPVLPAYLIWHASIALLETLTRGKWAWTTLKVERARTEWKKDELRFVWKLVAGMSAAAWLGALTVQMDKIVLSRMATIEQFGYYTIAATVAMGMLQLVYPLIQAALPRAIQLRADAAALRKLCTKLVVWIGLIAGAGTLIFVTAGKWLLELWLRSPQAVETVFPLLAVLLVGTVLNAFYNVGYVYWLAQEKIRRIFHVNALALLLSAMLIPAFVAWQGPIGAAFGWLVINLIGFLFSLGWIKTKTI